MVNEQNSCHHHGHQQQHRDQLGDCRKAEQEQSQIAQQPSPGRRELSGGGGDLGQGCRPAHQQRPGEQHQREPRKGQYRPEELAQRHAVMGVEVEVLGVAHRRCHTAQVGSHRLEHHHRHNAVGEPCHAEHRSGKGHKGDERHIIGDEHGSEEAEQHQHQFQLTGSAGASENALAQPLEEADVLQSCHHQHQAEEQSQGVEVHIAQPFPVRRHQKCRNQCQSPGCQQHRVPLESFQKQLHRQSLRSIPLNG